MINTYGTDDDVTAASTSTKSDKSTGDQPDRPLKRVGTGPLLEKKEPEVIKLVNGFWDDLEPVMAEKIANWKANAKRREGVIGVQVVKPNPDKAEWKVWAPPGAAKVPPTFNQPARLSRRLVSNLFVDPPLPEATPSAVSDEADPDAAEFTTRILQALCTAKRFNVPEIGEECVDLAATYDSAFARVYVDPRGSGSRPKTIMASQMATTVDDALYKDGDGVTPQDTPYVTRYVKDDDTLTDDQSEAALTWLPGLRYEILTGLNLRPIPASATSIEDCSGVVIRSGVKLSVLRDQYPEAFDGMTNDDLWELVQQRPAKSELALSAGERDIPQKKKDDDGPPSDDAIIIATTVYMGDGGQYPSGAYVVIGGNKRVLHRQKWEVTVNGVAEVLPIPIAHFKGWNEGKRTFYGYHLMHFLGPGNEVRAAALGGAIEHMDRFNRRKVFYSPQSLFQPKIGPAAQGVMVPIAQGTKPEVEEMPEYPRVGMELFDRATAELTDESGLSAIAQGNTDPSVQSGLHAQKIIEQTNIGLGTIKRSTDKGVMSLWMIALSFVRGYFSTTQQVRYLGDDQEYKQASFSSADMGDTKDVRIQKGSFTMLAPSAKLAVAEHMRTLNMIDDDTFRRLTAENAGGLLGLQDDPALLRIRRQVALWESGPPKSDHPSEANAGGFPGLHAQGNDPLQSALEQGQLSQVAPSIQATSAPAPAPVLPQGGSIGPPSMPAGPPQPGMEPQDPAVVGNIAPPAPPPPDPLTIAFQNIFRPAANDEEPAVAQIRFRELSRTMCGKKYERQPAEWRGLFDGVYEAARKAAGVGTTAEAAANQQAAAKAQMEQAQHEAQLKVQEVTATNDARAKADGEAAQLRAQAEIQKAQLTNQHDLEKTKMQLEHASIMKQADLSSQPGGEVELAKHKAELQQKHDHAMAEMEQKAQLEREKMHMGHRAEIDKAKIAANPKLAAALGQSGGVNTSRHIKIVRDSEGRIQGAEIEGDDTAKQIAVTRDASGRIQGADIQESA